MKKLFNLILSFFTKKEIKEIFWCSGCIEEWTLKQNEDGYKCYCERNGRTLKSVLSELDKK
jgi:hypothetical protein